MKNEKIFQAIIERIITEKSKNDKDLTKLKLWACRTYGLNQFPRNSDILSAATQEQRKIILQTLRLKPIRSVSGVYIITVMPKPYPCPKEDPCIFCPGGPKDGTPQSYTGKEPAGRRAIEHNFDPYQQVKSRIEQFHIMGHTVDKVELIIFGGTITCYPKDYLEWFVTQCLNALSDSKAKTIQEAQQIAENASIRNSDITIETRPDYLENEHINLMLSLGTTRVEIGVQTINDGIYQYTNRGHTIDDVVNATQRSKDAGFAVIYHMMPGLPGSDFQSDLESFNLIFNDQRFKPDAIKIYPTLILPGTKLYQIWKKGEYQPYTLDELVELLVKIKKNVPSWVRIQRVQRDIPLNLVEGGVKRGDLRMIVQKELQNQGSTCNCIRCREVGHMQYKSDYKPQEADIKFDIDTYPASGGEELFLTYKDKNYNALIGLVRLRNPSEKAYETGHLITKSMLVRELHVFGPTVTVGMKADKKQWQHRGWGEKLMKQAEKIAFEKFDAKKVIVLAGIGTRNYYRRFGYERDGPFMCKDITT
jgi:elongator complex protein 3 (tRNA carboxymethyluridine synthase)